MIKAQAYNITFHMTVSLSYQTNLSKSQTDDSLIQHHFVEGFLIFSQSISPF